MDNLTTSDLMHNLDADSSFQTQEARNTVLAHALLMEDQNLVEAALQRGANPNADISVYAFEALERRAKTISTADCSYFLNVSLLNNYINDKLCGFGAECNLPVMAMARSFQTAKPVFESDRLTITAKNGPILMAAGAYMGDGALLDAYKERGVDVNGMTYTGRKPIHLAAKGANTKTIPWLLQNGASAHSVYNTPEHIKRKGTNLANMKIIQNNITPLHVIAEDTCPDPARRVTAINRLVAAGANPNATASVFIETDNYRDDWQDYTPLHAAYLASSLDDDEGRQRAQSVIRHLQAKGASSNRKLNTGHTPAQLATFVRERNDRIMADLRTKQAEAVQRKRQQQASSSLNPSAWIAGAAAAGMAAYGMNKGGEVGAQAISTAGAMAADVASGGGTTHTQQQIATAQQQTQAAQTQQKNTTASPAANAAQVDTHCVAAQKNCLRSNTRRDGDSMHVTLTNADCGDVVSVRACARSTNPSFHRESYCWDTSIVRGQSITHTAPDAHPGGALWWQVAAANGPVASATGKAVSCRSEIANWGQYPNW